MKFLELLEAHQEAGRFLSNPTISRLQDKCVVKGLKLNLPKEGDHIHLHALKFDLIKDVYLFDNINISNFEFQDCNFSYSRWDAPRLNNCKFINCKFANASFWNPQFSKTDFIVCDYNETLLGGELRGKSGYFEMVTFERCKLKNPIFSHPLFYKTLFSNCSLENVHFRGSDFEYVAFEGLLDTLVFYDFYKWTTNSFWGSLLGKSKKKRNLFHHIDFSKAKFNDVTFIGDLDLSTTIFPANDDILIIKHPWAVFSLMRSIVEKEWTGKDKIMALNGIELEYPYKSESEKPIVIFIKHNCFEILGDEFATKYIGLMEYATKEIETSRSC